MAKLYKILAFHYELRYFRPYHLISNIMASILAFAGSNSSRSINFQLVRYTASLLKSHQVEVMDMSNFNLALYSEDTEREKGFTNSLIEFKEDLNSADGIIISVNEHNSNPSAFFKNLIDWLSRLERSFLQGANIFLMSTSKGKRGGLGSRETIEKLLPRFGASEVVTFSLPSFGENFSPDKGILDSELAEEHREALDLFLSKL